MKNTIITIIILLIVSFLFYLGYNKIIQQDNVFVGKQEEIKNEYGNFSEFIKDNLTEEEKKELINILAEREEKFMDIKNLLEKEFSKKDSERNLQDVQSKIAEIGDKLKSQILPFIKSEKKSEFDNFFNSLGAEIEGDYILK